MPKSRFCTVNTAASNPSRVGVSPRRRSTSTSSLASKKPSKLVKLCSNGVYSSVTRASGGAGLCRAMSSRYSRTAGMVVSS